MAATTASEASYRAVRGVEGPALFDRRRMPRRIRKSSPRASRAASEIGLVDAILDNTFADGIELKTLIVDKGYDYASVYDLCHACRIRVVCPLRHRHGSACDQVALSARALQPGLYLDPTRSLPHGGTARYRAIGGNLWNARDGRTVLVPTEGGMGLA